jgi:1,6-anhydro-N-acetylmuramate kinase
MAFARAVGLIRGTSPDGVDVALIENDGKRECGSTVAPSCMLSDTSPIFRWRIAQQPSRTTAAGVAGVRASTTPAERWTAAGGDAHNRTIMSQRAAGPAWAAVGTAASVGG